MPHSTIGEVVRRLDEAMYIQVSTIRYATRAIDLMQFLDEAGDAEALDRTGVHWDIGNLFAAALSFPLVRRKGPGFLSSGLDLLFSLYELTYAT